jgi:hypothetical protein
MATYKGIQGFTIQNLSADPSNPIEGQVWYNSTSNVWKVEEATTAGSWATGNTLNTARSDAGDAGTQTAALCFGGQFPPASLLSATEEYDGNSWTNSNPLNTARRGVDGAGTQTAAVAFGGDLDPPTVNATEEYDGTSWTNNPTGLNTARMSMGKAGIQTAALAFGGYLGGGSYSDATEEYDGSTWTNSPASMNTARGFWEVQEQEHKPQL